MGTVLDLGQAGTYTLEELLGCGGFGEVYRARQQGAAGFVQPVAIKRLRPNSQPGHERSFVDEARVLSRLHHENIARVYAFHECKGSYYLVMEYIDGLSLHALLELARRKGHRFSEPVACAIIAAVAKALDHAYQARGEADRPLHVIHRDVSPSNILIDRTGRVVLVDFGVARHEGEGRTPTGSGSAAFKGFKGKVPYLSPEQARHRPLDARSDLFSVGTILAEMLTGMAPFGNTTHFTTWKRIVKVTPEFVASRLPGVSRPLRALCQKLLARDPAQRFASGNEVAVALLRHVPPHQGPESIRAEVEKIQARPDAEAPPPPALALALAKAAAVRALSKVTRAKRTLAVASVFLFATVAVTSWYVPHHGAPASSSTLPPLLQGSAVSLGRPPATPLAPASPVSPPLDDALVGKLDGEGGAVAAAGSVKSGHRRNLAAPPSAPPIALADKGTSSPLIAPPVGRRTDEAVRAFPDSGEATDPLVGQPVTAQAQGQLAALTARYLRVPREGPNVEVPLDEQDSSAVRRALALARGQVKALRADSERREQEETSVDYAMAMLLVLGRSDLTPYVRIRGGSQVLREAGVEIKVVPFRLKKEGAGLGKAAMVFQVTNKDPEVPWELDDVRMLSTSGDTRPLALSAAARVVKPGRTKAFAVVIDAQAFGSNQSAHLALEIWQRLASGLRARQAVVEIVMVDERTTGP